MTAFRNALSAAYGAFGVHAFDGILGSRLAFGKSLRARDIAAVTRLAPQLAKKALENEIVRQLQNSPQYFRLHAENHPQTVAKAIVEYAYAHGLVKDTLYPTDAEGHGDFKAFLQDTEACIQRGAAKVVDAVLEANGDGLPAFDPREAAAEEARLKKGLDYDITSVEDQVRKGNVCAGMRLGNGKNPMIFVSLKEKGVEPGFVVRYDWSHSDTANMLLDVLDVNMRRIVAGKLLERPGSRAAHYLSEQTWCRPGMDKEELAGQLAGHLDAEAAIEAEATLEKLASPTTCMSRTGQVQLRHLEVAPKDRKPASIRKDGDGGFTITLGGVKRAESDSFIDNLKLILSNDAQHARLGTFVKSAARYDQTSETVTLKLDAAQFTEFIHALKEDDVYKLKHPADYPNRP